jgi:hypothetical protein
MTLENNSWPDFITQNPVERTAQVLSRIKHDSYEQIPRLCVCVCVCVCLTSEKQKYPNTGHRNAASFARKLVPMKTLVPPSRVAEH